MYNAPIIRRALEIIKLLVSEHEQLGVTDIAKSLSINKSTTFGILKALEEEGYITKDAVTKKYALGQEMFELSKMIFKRTDLTIIARPFLEKLAELVDETVFLGVKESDRVKIVDVIEAKKDLKISSSIGTKLPIVAGAVGKMFLSMMTSEEVSAYLKEKGLPRFTDTTITDLPLFLEEIEKTRHCGYGVDLEEYIKGVRAVATLIRSGGFPVWALWVVGFSSSINDDKLRDIIRHLRDVAQLIEGRIQSSILPLYLNPEDISRT
jgi:IclR family transcriptional regulator, KDG regulon repressor